MSKLERTVVLVAGVLVGLMLLPVFFTIGLMVIGVTFLAAAVTTVVRMAEAWRGEQKRQEPSHAAGEQI